MYSFIEPEMSHRATIGGGAIDRRAKLEVDRAAGLQRTAEAAARVDPSRPAAWSEASRSALVLGHREPLDRLAGLLDLRRAHLGEILRPQDLRSRHGQAGVEFDRGRRFALVAGRFEQGVGDAAGPGFRRLRVGLARRPRGEHRDQLFDETLSLPEDAERLVKQQAVLMLLHEDRVQRRVKVLPIPNARRLDRRQRVEHRARPKGTPASRKARAKWMMFCARTPPLAGSASKIAVISLGSISLRSHAAVDHNIGGFVIAPRGPSTRAERMPGLPDLQPAKLGARLLDQRLRLCALDPGDVVLIFQQARRACRRPAPGSSATASSSASAAAQSRVSATPGDLNRSCLRRR